MATKRKHPDEKRVRTKSQLRNLPQYKNLSDEEMDTVFRRVNFGDMDSKMIDVLASFEQDYDLSNMTANDKLSLEELARIFVILNELDAKIKSIIEAPDSDWNAFGSITRVTNQLRESASLIQRDLNITRKARQDVGDQSVVDFLEELKVRAKNFLRDRLCEIYCPDCNHLIIKVWFAYPDENTIIHCICGNCDNKFDIKSSELAKTRKNIEVGPPF